MNIEEFTRREIIYCVSNLIHTLAQNYAGRSGPLDDMCEYASELFVAPPNDEDYIQTAEEQFWFVENEGKWCWIVDDPRDVSSYLRDYLVEEDPEWFNTKGDAARDCCEVNKLDVDATSEIYEHWIVSDWMADRLEEQGELVDKNFYGLTIWARTTTGQAIYMDYVIKRIYDGLINA